MRVILNGEERELRGTTLHELLEENGYGGMTVATALNGTFVSAKKRAETIVRDGDRIEILAPMQGG